MIIGLDLSVLQTPHRMRGIGATAINFVNNIPADFKSTNKFILYLYDSNKEDALDLLDLSNLDYEVRLLIKQSKINLKVSSRLRIINSILNNTKGLLTVRMGDPRIDDLSGLDAFLQFDPMQALPKSRKLKKGLILYDLIPYIMEPDYLWTYRTARKNQNSRKGSIRKALLRYQYIKRAEAVSKTADELFAISNHTKNDYIKHCGIREEIIKVVHLGVNYREKDSMPVDISFEKYVTNSWGYFPKKINLTKKPFILFIGGADPRRKLNDLVAAYNNLKAQGYDIRLVLAGDIMKGPYAIPVPEVQEYIASSSYLKDIIFLGFVNDAQKEWLYANAIAMIYPSVYEGFGLPILEAMQYGTPVITYNNTSIKEIAGNAALYAHDFVSIKDLVEKLINDPQLKDKCNDLGKRQSSLFNWEQTTKKILNALTT